MSAPPLVLASRSPRRTELLTMLGLAHEALPADVDETYTPGEEPRAHARRLAREKAATVAALRPGSLVVGSDTVVLVDGDLLGKPADADEAAAMLLRLAGREHVVATGIAVALDGTIHEDVVTTVVRMRAFGAALARAYVATGEPMDKAGAYGIQSLGAALVEGVDGDFFTVMGLPVTRMLGLLEAHGWRYRFGALEAV